MFFVIFLLYDEILSREFGKFYEKNKTQSEIGRKLNSIPISINEKSANFPTGYILTNRWITKIIFCF